MGRFQSVLYRFEDCQCRNVAGGLDSIPAGTYSVAELDAVTVYVGAATFDLNKSAFNLLKAEGKARKVG